MENTDKIINVFLSSKPGVRNDALYDTAWYIAASDAPKIEREQAVKELLRAALNRPGFARKHGESKEPGAPNLYNAHQIKKKMLNGLKRGLCEPYHGRTQIVL